jgi:hypothetical protein
VFRVTGCLELWDSYVWDDWAVWDDALYAKYVLLSCHHLLRQHQYNFFKLIMCCRENNWVVRFHFQQLLMPKLIRVEDRRGDNISRRNLAEHLFWSGSGSGCFRNSDQDPIKNRPDPQHGMLR